MRVLQWIKKIINSIKKVKLLNSPGLETVEGIEEKSNFSFGLVKNELDINNEFALFERLQNKSNDKSLKIVELLKSIGCTDENLLEDTDFSDLDINNFRENIKLLTQLDVSKIELSIILGQNAGLIYIDSSILDNTITVLRKWIDDELIVKNIIYNNPFVVNDDIELNLEDKYKILEEHEIPNSDIKYVLDENPIILTMDKYRLEDSLNIIRSRFESQQDYLEEILGNSTIVGIIDYDYLDEYISKK